MRYWRDAVAVVWCLAVGMALVFGGARCSAAKPACQVVDVAHTACEYVVLQVQQPDGTVREVRVPRAEIEVVAARHQDAGAP